MSRVYNGENLIYIVGPAYICQCHLYHSNRILPMVYDIVNVPGVHFAFDGEKGCEAGTNIANHIFENIYLPHNQQSRQSMSTDSLPAAIEHYLAHTPTSGNAPETCDETPAYPLLV